MKKPNEKFKPMLDRVLVRRAKVRAPGDLVIPEQYEDEPDRGYVVSVGPGRPGVPMTLKEGDKVLLDRAAVGGQAVKINDETFLVLYESEVAGTLE